MIYKKVPFLLVCLVNMEKNAEAGKIVIDLGALALGKIN
jgi:hypothetical protein